MNRTLCPLLLVPLLLIICPATVLGESRVFELQHQPASELVAPIRELLDPSAKVSAYKNTLAVVGSPQDLQLAEQLVARFDRRMRMFKVMVDQGMNAAGNARNLGASGRLESGNIIIGGGPTDRRSSGGGNVSISGDRGRITVFGQETTTRDQRSVSQFMAMMEGQAARLTVGKSIPYTRRYTELCRRYGRCIETIEFRNVETGFEVTPRMAGEQVELEIRPYMAFLDPTSRDVVVFQELASRVLVPPGTWYELGGQLQQHDEVSREILGSRQGATTGNNSMRIRVELQ